MAAFGFCPNLLAELVSLPRAVATAEKLIEAVLVRQGPLPRLQKQRLLHAVARVWNSEYCLALYHKAFPFHGSSDDSALMGFARKLAARGAWVSRNDLETLRKAGLDDRMILESIATVALGQFLCTLAEALRPALDPGLESRPVAPTSPSGDEYAWPETPGPYLPSLIGQTGDFPSQSFFREQFGFVPNLFRSQAGLADLLEAEVYALQQVLVPDDLLTRIRKEYILLSLSATNLNACFVAVHRQILDALGVPLSESDQIVDDHHQARISAAEQALLDEVRKLTFCQRFTRRPEFQAQALATHGFTEPQIVEAVAMAGLTNFLNTVQFGLGTLPDFPPARVFNPKDLYPGSPVVRPTSDVSIPEDPDADLVARVQNGDVETFEELVRRHTRRVFGTLVGLLGNTDDAHDATQDVFLKAFAHIHRFQGRAKFSTWLVSIAINTGTELLRQRKPAEPLEDMDDEESFRPRQVQSWVDDPEQLLVAAQRDVLVREGVQRLPPKYRIAVVLRDINQLSTEEAAAALGLSVPALKARVLRGRLMLRESLAPHFIRPENRSPDAQLR